MSYICEAQNLYFAVDGAVLLRDISIALSRGEVVALIGPNGAGKSTLLRTLAGEYTASGGSIRYDGRPIGAWTNRELACIRSVMSQAQELSFPFRVEEIVNLGVDGVAKYLRAGERREIVDACAEIAGVSHMLERRYQTLSGGERQRVHFARVLAQLRAGRADAPRQLLFLDEPVSSLDIGHQWKLMENIRKLAATGLSVLVVIHDINLALTYADRVAVLRNGGLVSVGEPAAAIDEAIVSDVFEISRRPDADASPSLRVVPQTFQAKPMNDWGQAAL